MRLFHSIKEKIYENLVKSTAITLAIALSLGNVATAQTFTPITKTSVSKSVVQKINDDVAEWINERMK